MLVLSSCSILPKNTGNGNTDPKETGQETSQEKSNGTKEGANLKVSDYFPMLTNVYMKYKGTGNEFAAMDRYVDYVMGNRIQFRDDNGGTVASNVYEVGDGSVRLVYSQGESYARVNRTSLNNADEIVLKEPLAVGNEWTLKDGTKRSITAVDKPIATPMGSFSAIEVTTKHADATEQEYYAKGIGLVKRVYTSSNDPDFTVVTELEALEKDTPFKTNVRIYYPDYNVEKVYYIDKAMELKTNEDPYPYIQDELKKTPKAGSRVLTPGANVLGVDFDIEKGMLVLDFAKQLVDEMNAGSGYEAMLLECIADTFGGYYQAQKVGITLEGKPYSSGHIIIAPGEYLLTVDPSNAVPMP